MAYDKKLFDEAEKIIAKRRHNSIAEFEKRKKEIYNAIPKISKIDNLISKTSVDVAKEVLANKANLQDTIKGLMLKNSSLNEEKKLLLIKNNYPTDYLEFHYHCQNCEDKGFTKNGICNCMKKILKDLAYKKLNMSVNIKNFTFSKFNIDYYPNNYIASEKSQKTPREIAADNLKFCENYAYSFSKNSKSILMQGGTGLGKTHLSFAIASHCIENGIGVIYTTAQQLINKLESDKFKNTQEGFLESTLDCNLLIIDDLGTEFYTQFTTSAFQNIINSRLLENKATIITTNLSIEELISKYSPRVVSRIVGEYQVLTFYGKDIRLFK